MLQFQLSIQQIVLVSEFMAFKPYK